MNNYKFSLSKAADILKSRISAIDNLSIIFELPKNDFRKWQVDELSRWLSHAEANSKFYKNKFRSIDIKEKIRNNEFHTIPFTTRNELMQCYPFGNLATPFDEIIRYGESSGTESSPIASYYTHEDWIKNNATVAFFLAKILDKSDIVAVAVPYELASVGQDIDRALELISCTTIAVGALTKVCPPERMIELFKNLEVTALVCLGTRAIFLSDIAKELGFDSKKDFHIKNIFCVGEGISKTKAKLIEELWGAKVYSMYGMTETNTLGMFCPHGNNHLIESKIYFEVIDPLTDQVVGEDKFGELVVTSLNSKAMPLIRYKTGDLVRINSKPCECGLHFRTYDHLGRKEDRVKIDNKDHQILSLEEDILQITKSKYYRLETSKNILKIGLCLSETECNNVSKQLIDTFNLKYNIQVEVIPIEKEEFDNTIRNFLKPGLKNTLINS